MSRHPRPSLFQFPRAPLSPPDTNAEIIGPAPMPYTAIHLTSHDLRPNEAESSPARSAPTPDTFGARFRKIAYHSSGLKESRERTPHRAPKAFVIILPPSTVVQEHGQLGTTLGSGPRHRLSNGLLMPLFPTMYGQLTAIAREFNFPSITGLCLYPHIFENDQTMAPRISDEYWPFLWSYVFDPSYVPKSMIAGKIEFDVDLRQARWYTSWLAAPHRDNLEHPFSIISSAPPSFSHDRADSKTTFREDDPEEMRSNAPTTRHVPRKLSLVDRYDTLSARSLSRPASRSGLSPPEHPYPSSRVLSPIFQDEEPKSAKHDLDNRVNSWRASAILHPTALVPTGQTEPNSELINDALLDPPNGDQVNLEDFAWSVTSAGPDDYDPMSPVPWDREPSVHIANRAEGSVCLTPSTCTSFGPSDYPVSSPASSLYRLPSPDLAFRVLDNVPLTPSTATSWGAPLEFPPSPVWFSRPASVDLGERGIFSQPVTPTTATSWGPASWPASPVYSDHSSRSIHLGDRGHFSRPVTPSTATSWGAPASYPPSPVTPVHISTPAAWHRVEDADVLDNDHNAAGSRPAQSPVQPNPRHTPWTHSWPYRSRKSSQLQIQTIPWKHSWPYRKRSSHILPSAANNRVNHEGSQIRTIPWGHSWPYRKNSGNSLKSVADFSRSDSRSGALPWKHSWPYLRRNVSHSPMDMKVTLLSGYPRFVLYPPVYPHFDLYPAVTFSIDKAQIAGYPDLRLYLEPASNAKADLATQTSVASRPCYPEFNIYPPIYPHNLYQIYPPVNTQETLFLYGSRSFTYPFFDLYPEINGNPTQPPHRAAPTVNVTLKHSIQGYPHFNLYPAIDDSGYPHFNLYPSIELGLHPIAAQVKMTYPFFDIYPAVYPHFDLYPAAYGKALATVQEEVAFASGYPDFDLYPSLPREKKGPKPPRLREISHYPSFVLYPPVYPYFDIYPAPYHATSNVREMVGYPHFDLYPACTWIPEASRTRTMISGLFKYPIFNLYPTVYPHFDLYPATDIVITEAKTVELSPAQSQRPGLIPRPAGHSQPFLVDTTRLETISKAKMKPAHRLTHRELHAMVKMERVRPTRSFQSKELAYPHARGDSVSHNDPHSSVFPDHVATPNGTLEGSKSLESRVESLSPSEALRRRISTLRPSSARVALPASPRPTGRLPPPANHSDHLSASTLDSPSGSKSIEEESSPRLSRSASLMKVLPQSDELNEPGSRLSSVVVAPPRRRDSLVSQRIRTFNDSKDGIKVSMNTLAEFPLSTAARPSSNNHEHNHLHARNQYT